MVTLNNLLILGILLFSPFIAAAQVSGVATYNTRLVEDVLPIEEQLSFDGRTSLSVKMQSNEPKKELKKTGQIGNNTDNVRQTIISDPIGHVIFRNHSEQGILVRTLCRPEEPLLYRDMPKMEWKLGKREKTIEGLACKDAYTTFRGRNYEVWYAPSVPVNAGPWKFSGLPGLIVEVSDKKKEVSIRIRSLELRPLEKPLANTLTGQETTLKEVLKCMHEEHEKLNDKLEAAAIQVQADYPTVEIEFTRGKFKPTELKLD